MEHYLPDCTRLAKGNYCNALWLETPDQISSQRLASRAAQRGVLIETGYSHFMGQQQANPETNTYFRLGFHAIDKALITPGVEQLARALGARLFANLLLLDAPTPRQLPWRFFIFCLGYQWSNSDNTWLMMATPCSISLGLMISGGATWIRLLTINESSPLSVSLAFKAPSFERLMVLV
ncbi:transcriptional regulator [Vibrio sp. JCM 19236]|nr:transcriptional regulator [Vibrio sp. JCM 19236]